MELIVIRHGLTQSNMQGLLQGQRIDDPLLPATREQVQLLNTQLKDKNVSALYSSHLLRARQTAEVLSASLDLPVRVTQKLAERDFGSLSGLTWEDAMLQVNDYTLKEKDKQFQFDYRPYGGESIYSVRKRLKNLLQECAALYQEKTIAWVTHGGIIRLLYDELEQKQPDHVSNTSLHVFEYT
ncbi:MAG: histidine phosphatase family protein [Candidatus Andersenbacteria bacterium]